jgi:peptidoglycan/xylan/chitin deacetylase (PgdA/CDA1 family)
MRAVIGKLLRLPVPMRLLRQLNRYGATQLVFRTHNAVALSFDDGPHPELTPRLLDTLAQARVAATFFVQGCHARRWPELVRRCLAGGHQVASHGMEHVSALTQSASAAIANGNDCHQLLCDVTGQPLPRYYRPPYGQIGLQSLLGLRRLGFVLAWWSIDSNDSYVNTAPDALAQIRRQPITSGDIVLFHDDYPHTAEALPAIVRELAARGLSFDTIHRSLARAATATMALPGTSS